MEAVPKMPMLSFSLKQTTQKSSFSRLKQYIAEFYQEDPELYSREIYELETLRAAAYNPSTDINGCNLIKRYFCQLHSLQNRFPIENDHHLVGFNWRDIYSGNSTQSTDLKHDMAVVLYNYAALHTVLGSAMTRATEEEMKLACTHFQCAAWAFETVRDKYGMTTTGDLCPEILIFMQQISYAQAQECILEKGLIDNRKSIIVAKVTAQIIEYYNTALAALLTGGEDGIVSEVVGSKLFKEWKQYVQFKVLYMTCILLLYQGQHAEEQQKMGERVALYQTAFDRLEEARKASRGMNNGQAINEALAFVMDVVEAKRKSARNENEFIYHEEVPEISSISSVPPANLVKGTSFSVTDPTLLGEDIFHRLVPIKAHETSSLYSEEKAALLRRIGQKIDAKDTELNKFMESLNIDSLNYDANDVKLPQSLIDRCADLNAKPNAIPDLISKMSSLAEICVDVENMLGCIQELLNKEESDEKEFQQTMGYRPSSHFIELNREFMKYQEAHSKAGGSNDTLRKAMELHVNNLKILARPLAEVQAAIPTCGAEINPNALNETRNLLNKVNEMRMQRAQLYSQLNDDIQKDDITSQLIAWGDKNVDQLFKTELAKHEPLTAIIEQNLVAQGNILKAFTDAYAKCAHFIKAVADTKHKRETFLSSLIASYDVYDDLLGKSLKGLEFYKKLQSNIHKLSARVRSACDVNEEERQQRIESLNKKVASANATIAPQPKQSQQPTQPQPTVTSIASHLPSTVAPLPPINQDIAASMPKLSDYEKYESYRNSSIRPTPIGQENTAISSTCLTSITGSVAYDAKQIVPNATIASNTPYNYAAATSVSYTMPSSDGYNTGNFAAPVSTQYKGTHAGYDLSGASNAGYVNPMYSNFPSSAQSPYSPAYYNVDEQSANTPNTHPPGPKQVEPSLYRPSTHPSPAPSPQTSDGRNSYANYQPNESTMQSSNVYSTMQYAPPAEPSLPTYSASTVGYHDQQYQTYSQYPSVLANSQANPSLSYPPASVPSYLYAEPNYSTSQQQPISSASNSAYNYASVYSQPQQQTQYTGQYHQPMPSTNDQMTAMQNDPSAYGAGNVYYNPNVPGSVQQYASQNVQPSYPAASQNNQYYTDAAPVPTADVQYTDNANANYPNANYNQNVAYSNYNYNAMHSAVATSQPIYATTSNAIPNPAPAPATVAPQPATQVKPKSRIDLLSDLEDVSIAAPTLQPIKSQSILVPTKKGEPAPPAEPPVTPANPVEITMTPSKPTEPNPTVTAPKAFSSSISDVTSLESELSHLSMVDSFSKVDQTITKSNASSVTDLSISITGPAAATSTSSVNIEAFFKEVQRYEKTVNNLQTKTLNGTTSLAIKWKDLNDLLLKDAHKRTVSVSKLFPEKNRNMLCVPYDHARVLLPTETDNYINAAHLKFNEDKMLDLGSRFSHFILADAPTFNTIKDFWCMIWSQKSKYIVSLSTAEETQNQFFPKQLNVDTTFGDYTVTILSEQNLSHSIERAAKVTSHDSNESHLIVILQAKAWPVKSSVNNILGISQNVVDLIQSRGEPNVGPIVLTCSTSCERSSLVALTITSISALAADAPIIINVSDIWYRICSQRKNVISDSNVLQLSMQIVLQCCREFIKKKSLTAPPNNSATQINYFFIEEEETAVKDPFKDLDPLWKLK